MLLSFWAEVWAEVRVVGEREEDILNILGVPESLLSW